MKLTAEKKPLKAKKVAKLNKNAIEEQTHEKRKLKKEKKAKLETESKEEELAPEQEMDAAMENEANEEEEDVENDEAVVANGEGKAKSKAKTPKVKEVKQEAKQKPRGMSKRHDDHSESKAFISFRYFTPILSSFMHHAFGRKGIHHLCWQPSQNDQAEGSASHVQQVRHHTDDSSSDEYGFENVQQESAVKSAFPERVRRLQLQGGNGTGLSAERGNG